MTDVNEQEKTVTSPVTSCDEADSTPPDTAFDLEAQKVCPPFCRPPPSFTPEHFRDIDLGPFTLHRFFLVLYIVAVIIGIHYIQNVIWPPSTAERDLLWTLLGLIWFVPLPSMLAWVVGALLFRYPTDLDEVQFVDRNVVLRIVSRGTNAECLLTTIRKCQSEMRKTPLFPYLVEVVTDGNAFVAPDDPDVLHTKVPDSYVTPNGSRFKARALHYACLYSVVPSNTWVVHLDEESQPTSSSIKGIADMIAKCEHDKDVRRVGQGAILYHRGWGTHPLFTLADMRRTGDDIGHFYLQHRIGFTIFGLHGSYVVVRQDVEQEIGFDVGPDGSITEDAWWILLAMERGIRTMYVDGYISEQSCQGLVDFLKQRRRWYVGLWKVGLHCPVGLHYRALLLFNTLSWVVVPLVLPLQLVYLTLSIVFNKQIILAIRILTNLILAATAAVYLSGLVVNMREHGTPWYRGIMWVFLQIVLLPVFLALEVAAILLAFFSPLSRNAKGFHIITKSGHTDEETLSSTVSSEQT